MLESYLNCRRPKSEIDIVLQKVLMLRLVFLRVVSLGPLLFILFSNDNTDLVKHCRSYLYCDNLKIFTESQSSDTQRDINERSIWLQVSGIFFHAEKKNTLIWSVPIKTMRDSISKVLSSDTYTAWWVS